MRYSAHLNIVNSRIAPTATVNRRIWVYSARERRIRRGLPQSALNSSENIVVRTDRWIISAAVSAPKSENSTSEAIGRGSVNASRRMRDAR